LNMAGDKRYSVPNGCNHVKKKKKKKMLCARASNMRNRGVNQNQQCWNANTNHFQIEKTITNNS
jgi:hypothetical protein